MLSGLSPVPCCKRLERHLIPVMALTSTVSQCVNPPADSEKPPHNLTSDSHNHSIDLLSRFSLVIYLNFFSHVSSCRSSLITYKGQLWRSAGTGCPGRWWSLLLWRYSRPSWTRSSTIYCRWPCFGRRSGLDDPQRSLPTPAILLFCDSVTLNLWKVTVFFLWKKDVYQNFSLT